MQFIVDPRSVSESDVVVVGGGTAGVFAAISAAMNGAKTILVEKNSALGGTMTTGGVNFPGLFYAWGRQIIDGPCWDAVKRTVALAEQSCRNFSINRKSTGTSKFCWTDLFFARFYSGCAWKTVLKF